MKTKRLTICLLLFTFQVHANFIETKWKVVGFVGEPWFADTKSIIGKTQSFEGGWSEGIFYSCDYAGQSMTYNTYSVEEFLNNKEFYLFKELNIKFIKEKIYVHRISCNGKKDFQRKVMHPFVTQENSKKGYYLFEGAIYILEY